MDISILEMEFEPETFTPMEGFVVFKDHHGNPNNQYGKIIGCANIRYEDEGDQHKIVILDYLEAYNQHGAKIVNAIMNLAPLVTIRADTYEDTRPFWRKMGAEFYTVGNEIDTFELRKEEFMKTKYYSEIMPF